MTGGLAVLLLSTALVPVAIALVVSTPAPSRRRVEPGAALRSALAAGAGVAVVLVSGWLLPAGVVAVGTWSATRAWQRRDRHSTDDVARTDALASWIESLRDVLIAGEQPVGAITATVSACPAAIRAPVRRLAAGLGRQDPDIVFRRFADDIDDPLGDLVAAGLLIAVRRGARTASVLTTLAEQARRQADRRRIIDAERAPMQREVRLLTITMAALIASLLVLGRATYLAPYGSVGGQVFLSVVLALYAALLVRVHRLGRRPRPQRFIGAGLAPRATAGSAA